VLGTKNVLQACKSQKVPYLVYTSSPSVVFNGEDITGDESLPYGKKPLAMYPKSKAIAEELVLQANSPELKTTALRPHLIFGAGDPHFIPKIKKAQKSGRLKALGNLRNKVDVTHVHNAAWAHVQVMEKMFESEVPCGKSYFIGQEMPVNLWSFLDALLKAVGLKPVSKKSPISYKKAYYLGLLCESLYGFFKIYKKDPPMTRMLAYSLAKSHYFNHERAFRDFGYRPVVSIKKGLEDLASSHSLYL
jgi:nucleoside-diphosphate-sugar epimerase